MHAKWLHLARRPSFTYLKVLGSLTAPHLRGIRGVSRIPKIKQTFWRQDQAKKQPMNGWDGQTCRGGWRSAPGQRVLAGGALLLRATSNPLSRPPPCPAKSQPLQRRPPPRPFRFTNQNFREARHHLLPSRPLHHLNNWSRYPSHAIATAQLEFFLYRPSTSRQ
jgi:hypothetical protein